MPHLRQLPSGKWQGGVRDPATGKLFTKAHPTKVDAWEWALTVERRLHRAAGRPVDDEPAPTVGELGQRYLDGLVIAPATVRLYTQTYRRHIEPAWANVAVDTLAVNRGGREAVQAWVAAMHRAGVGPYAIRRAALILGAVLDLAVGQSLAGNPGEVRRLTLPAAVPSSERVLDPGEQAALTAVLDEPYRTLVAVDVLTGLRWGEIAGLRAHRLDLTESRVVVRDVLQRDGTIREYPKSKRPRTVPLPAGAVTLLARHLDSADVGRAQLVFTAGNARPLDYQNFWRRIWQPALRAAGLDDPPAPTFHDLRHTYATGLAQAGVPTVQIAALLGHASTQTTERYVHAAGPSVNRAWVAHVFDGQAAPAR